MPITTPKELLEALRQLHLLDSRQLDDLTARLQGKNIPPRALAQKLIELGWVTAFQVNQLLQGQAKQLLLGSYVLLDRLGEGGMGAVYRARNWKMGNVVAVKVMRQERVANPTAVQRFQREIRAAAKLHHPNIVKAIDAGEANGTHLFVMEYVEGTDLNKLVKDQGPLSVDQACDCIRQASLGLQHAHEKGMVHRDIKPHNLLLARPKPGGTPASSPGAGVVKLLDMGLARIADDDASTITQEGSVMGTMDYLAPEQARNSHTVDIRGDLYSLGCTFHFLLTGQVPFPGGTAAEKMFKHQFDEPVAVNQIRPHVPAGIAAVVRKLMAKRPDDRYQTPAELAAVLSNGVPTAAIQVQAGRPGIGGKVPTGMIAPPAPVPPADTIDNPDNTGPIRRPAWRRSWVVLPIIAFVGLLAVGLVFFLRSGSPSGMVGLEKVREPVTMPGKPELDKDWVQLFNGKDLAGWKSHATNPGNWSIKDGLLIGTRGNPGYLFSERGDFSNFHLRARVKLNARGDSGIFFRTSFGPLVDYFGRVGPPGYEAQICNDASAERTGSLYRVQQGAPYLAREPNQLVQPDQWFTLEVIAQGPQLTTKVNAKQTASIRHDEFVRGHIALQIWHDTTVVQFEKIEIKDLPPSK